MLSHCDLNVVGGRGGAGAMLNAVTALEGLLPILPVEAVRQQVIKARQVLVQAAMLAEAPSLSAAAAGGPAEETQPSLLVDMLLSPLHHPLATPQLRDRLAGLLLQVQTSPHTSYCCVIAGIRQNGSMHLPPFTLHYTVQSWLAASLAVGDLVSDLL